MRDQWVALGILLVGYWAAFVLFPLPPADFDFEKVGVPRDWPHLMSGFSACWNKNSNLAWAFDTWFLNIFPRDHPFTHNGGGYATLSFIPTLGTMILGLIAGGVVRSARAPWEKVRWLGIAGAACLAGGWLLGAMGVCPVVKRIWTPSWTIFSGGWCFLLLAGFYLVIDLWQRKAWAFPLVVIGMNSIAAYMIAHLFEDFIRDALRTHLGAGFFTAFGYAYEPFVLGSAILLSYWLILYWMYKRKLFLRI